MDSRVGVEVALLVGAALGAGAIVSASRAGTEVEEAVGATLVAGWQALNNRLPKASRLKRKQVRLPIIIIPPRTFPNGWLPYTYASLN